MGARRLTSGNVIWLIAIGYMIFYLPYSGMVKLLSNGLLLPESAAVPRFAILPIVLVGAVVLVALAITFLGWWRYLPTRRVLGISVPAPRLLCILSGLGTACIIVTTTLAYTFHGISIVFALLLMRGGVLVMSPVVDWTAHREVHLWAWIGLVLSVAAVVVALTDQGGYVLSTAAVVNLLVYLGGYCIRLEAMSRLAKSPVGSSNRRFFVEEQTASLFILLAVPLTLAIIGTHDIMHDLRAGYVGLFSAAHAGPAWVIGLLYGCLFMFGSFIYLDSRENTFCIPINRCMSVIAGLIATALLSAWFNQPGVATAQIVAVFLILTALSALGVPSIQAARRRTVNRRWLQSVNIIFVCDGNTSRSPMGEIMCRAQFAKELGLDMDEMRGQAGWIASAGLRATDGTRPRAATTAALEALDLPAIDHASRTINAQMVDDADWVFCMTEAQRSALLERFPGAAEKTLRLHSDVDIANPSGGSMADHLETAQHIAAAVESRVSEFLTSRTPAFTN